jgi:hypothetical protein
MQGNGTTLPYRNKNDSLKSSLIVLKSIYLAIFCVLLLLHFSLNEPTSITTRTTTKKRKDK